MMNIHEKELFFELCKFKNPDEHKLSSLLEKNATSAVLGELFFNRMQGIAYGVLAQTELLGKTNREFRNSLGNAYRCNAMLNMNYADCIDLVSRILKNTETNMQC